MTSRTYFFAFGITTSLLLLGCGSSKKKTPLQADKDAAAKRAAAAAAATGENPFTGVFDLKLTDGKVDCDGHPDRSRLTATDVTDRLSCTGQATAVECSLSDQTKFTGTAPEANRLILSGPSLANSGSNATQFSESTTLDVTFSEDRETASGTYKAPLAAVNGLRAGVCAYEWTASLERVSGVAAAAPSSNNNGNQASIITPQLSLQYETDHASGSRQYNDVRLRHGTNGQLTVGFKGLSEERGILTFIGEHATENADGTSASLDLVGIEGQRPLSASQQEKCSHEVSEASGHQVIDFDCAEISGRVALPTR